MARRRIWIALAAALLGGITVIAQTTRPSAESLIAAFRAVTPPQFDNARRNDQSYVASFVQLRNAYNARRAEAAKAFYDAYPDDPSAMDILEERWVSLIQSGHASEVDKEAQQIIAANPNTPKSIDARYIRAIAVLMTQPETNAEEPLVEDFIKAAPNDERGGQLLYRQASLVTDQKVSHKLYRRVIDGYPKSNYGRMAAGALRQVDGLGKPFDLDFTDAITGKPVSVAAMKGKVVVIDFWATWCGPCVQEMPHMKDLYSRYKNRGVEFVGVSLDAPEPQNGLTLLKDFVRQNEIPWPQYYQGNGWDSTFSSSWGIQAIPSVFLIDSDGNLHSTDANDSLERMIQLLLEQRSKAPG